MGGEEKSQRNTGENGVKPGVNCEKKWEGGGLGEINGSHCMFTWDECKLVWL